MPKKNKDLRDIEQRQSDVGNPKEQQNNTEDIGNNDIQTTKLNLPKKT